jgi:hypothetical protein
MLEPLLQRLLKKTLSKCQAMYRILEETPLTMCFRLNIMLIEITAEGTCLVGGPSSVDEMSWLIGKMKTYGLDHFILMVPSFE